MTEQIDRDALRAEAQADIDHDGPCAWAGIGAADLLALLDALTRAEAQSAIRGRAVTIYQQRASEAEAERDEWRQTALDERGAALDALEQIKVRDARIKAVLDMCDDAEDPDQWPPRPVMHGGEPFPESLMVDAIRRALEG